MQEDDNSDFIVSIGSGHPVNTRTITLFHATKKHFGFKKQVGVMRIILSTADELYFSLFLPVNIRAGESADILFNVCDDMDICSVLLLLFASFLFFDCGRNGDIDADALRFMESDSWVGISGSVDDVKDEEVVSPVPTSLSSLASSSSNELCD